MARGHTQNARNVIKQEAAPWVPVNQTSGPVSGFYDDGLSLFMDCEEEPVVRDPKDNQVVGIPVGHLSKGYFYEHTPSQYGTFSGLERSLNPSELPEHFIPRSDLDARTIDASCGDEAKPSVIVQYPVPEHVQPLEQTHERSAAAKDKQDYSTLIQSNRLTTKRKAKEPKPRVQTGSCSVAESDEDAKIQDASTPSIVTVKTETFRIGDLPRLKDYFERRFGELTNSPLKKICEGWIKMIEPHRRKIYEPYNKTKPADNPTGKYPSWWPRDTQYEEPAHLGKKELIGLCVTIMLLHRYRDDNGKPRINWTRELKEKAFYMLQDILTDNWASSRKPEYNAAKKEVAMKQVIPEIFDVAQSYEDHVAQYGLYDDQSNENTDAPLGKQHTWCPGVQPKRQPPEPKKVVSKPKRPSRAQSTMARKRRRCESSDLDAANADDAQGVSQNFTPCLSPSKVRTKVMRYAHSPAPSDATVMSPMFDTYSSFSSANTSFSSCLEESFSELPAAPISKGVSESDAGPCFHGLPTGPISWERSEAHAAPIFHSLPERPPVVAPHDQKHVQTGLVFPPSSSFPQSAFAAVAFPQTQSFTGAPFYSFPHNNTNMLNMPSNPAAYCAPALYGSTQFPTLGFSQSPQAHDVFHSLPRTPAMPPLEGPQWFLEGQAQYYGYRAPN